MFQMLYVSLLTWEDPTSRPWLHSAHLFIPHENGNTIQFKSFTILPVYGATLLLREKYSASILSLHAFYISV